QSWILTPCYRNARVVKNSDSRWVFKQEGAVASAEFTRTLADGCDTDRLGLGRGSARPARDSCCGDQTHRGNQRSLDFHMYLLSVPNDRPMDCSSVGMPSQCVPCGSLRYVGRLPSGADRP